MRVMYVPAKIGDYVWEDADNDGTQGIESGVGGVTVELFNCGPDGVVGTSDDGDSLGTRVTDNADGMYMFGGEPGVYDLAPGSYYVQFDSSTFLAGYDFTTPNVGDEDMDSNCLPPSGFTQCTTLGSRGINMSQDCGIVPPTPSVCDLGIDVLCRVEPQPSTMVGDKCSGKLQQFTLVWDGPDGVYIDSVNMGTTSTSGPINNGDTVTMSGPYSSNDVILDISGAVSGQSTFHVSCSDDNFNSDDDCGKLAGNGKDDASSMLNMWMLEGFIDADGDVLDCNPGGNMGEFTQNCSINEPVAPSCDTLGKPNTLTFEYTGGSCPGDNDQGSKADCSGAINGAEMATLSVNTGGGYSVTPSIVAIGDTFTVTKGGSDFSSNTDIDLSNSGGTQQNDVHTSCSAPLAVGDVFGAITLVGINGETGGADVTYKYVVTNNGDPVTDIDVNDVPFGYVGTIDSLDTNEMDMLTLMASITGATTNVATASAVLDGEECTASDTSTVEVIGPPPCEIIGESEIKLSKKKLEWKIQNVGTDPAVIDRIEMSWPEATNGALEYVKIGKKEIVKDDESGPTAVITTFNGSESDRTIKLGKAKTIKFGFDHNVSKTVGDYMLKIFFKEGCEVEFDPASLPAGPFVCSDAKPIDELSMIWNGDDPVTVSTVGNDGGLQEVSGITNGTVVTFDRLSDLGNDVYWQMAGAVDGESGFHMSCSDDAMNGPEDCGSPQGNNKNNDDGLNVWLFNGMKGLDGSGFTCP